MSLEVRSCVKVSRQPMTKTQKMTESTGPKLATIVAAVETVTTTPTRSRTAIRASLRFQMEKILPQASPKKHQVSPELARYFALLRYANGVVHCTDDDGDHDGYLTWHELTKFISKEGMAISSDGTVVVGAIVAFRWPEGWLTGRVVKRTNNVRFPWDVQYDDGVWPQLLGDTQRQGGSSASDGSWVLLHD